MPQNWCDGHISIICILCRKNGALGHESGLTKIRDLIWVFSVRNGLRILRCILTNCENSYQLISLPDIQTDSNFVFSRKQ